MLLHIPQFLLNLGHEKYLLILGIIIPSWTLLMIVFERIFPYTVGVKLFRRGFWVDLIWYTFIQSKLMEMLIFSFIILGLKSYLGLENFGPFSEYNFWILLFGFFLVHDFYIYWFHRFQHNNRYLWRTHEAHHSNREIDWLAGSRSHFLEILINQTIEFAPIFFLLDTQTALFMYPAKATIDAIWGIWIHANVNVKSGKLQYIINGPEMHQWHHANHHEVFYKNYGTKLAIWDWIFGTGFLPNLKPLTFEFTKPQMFGLPYAYPKGFFTQTVFAIHRFDFIFVEFHSFYERILNFRKNAFSKFLKLFTVKESWTKSEIFDTENQKFNLDDLQPKCKTCHKIQKYFYKNIQIEYLCENCQTDSELYKFN